MISYLKAISKFTEFATGKFSGNIAYNRKLFKIKVKSLENNCYSVNFWKSCGKNPVILLKYEPFRYVLQILNLEYLFSKAALSNCFGISGRWAKDELKVSLFQGPLQRSTCCQRAT